MGWPSEYVGPVGSCCLPFDYTLRTRVVLYPFEKKNNLLVILVTGIRVAISYSRVFGGRVPANSRVTSTRVLTVSPLENPGDDNFASPKTRPMYCCISYENFTGNPAMAILKVCRPYFRMQFFCFSCVPMLSCACTFRLASGYSRCVIFRFECSPPGFPVPSFSCFGDFSRCFSTLSSHACFFCLIYVDCFRNIPPRQEVAPSWSSFFLNYSTLVRCHICILNFCPIYLYVYRRSFSERSFGQEVSSPLSFSGTYVPGIILRVCTCAVTCAFLSLP